MFRTTFCQLNFPFESLNCEIHEITAMQVKHPNAVVNRTRQRMPSIDGGAASKKPDWFDCLGRPQFASKPLKLLALYNKELPPLVLSGSTLFGSVQVGLIYM